MIQRITDKGETMRISRQTRQTIDSTGAVSRESGVETRTAPAIPDSAPLASERLAPAREALAALPDVDLARVAEVKAALARGEIRMDASRLAEVIRRYHGGS